MLENEINKIVQFLCSDGIRDDEVRKQRYDIIIFAGNCLPQLAKYCAKLLDARVSPTLLISGGIGHGTRKLIENIKKDSQYQGLSINEQEREAQILRELVLFHKTQSHGEIMLESTSTNTGENAQFSYDVIQDRISSIHKVLLVQDPLLSKRTLLTFTKHWDRRIQFYQAVPYIPSVKRYATTLTFDDPHYTYAWNVPYFFSLLTGEIERLRDDENGYGPKGAGYIEHIDVAQDLTQCVEVLKRHVACIR